MASSGQEKVWDKSSQRLQVQEPKLDPLPQLRELGRALRRVQTCHWVGVNPLYCLDCSTTHPECEAGRALRAATSSVFALARSL